MKRADGAKRHDFSHDDGGEGEGGWMCNQQWIERIDCDRMVEKWSDELADCRIVARPDWNSREDVLTSEDIRAAENSPDSHTIVFFFFFFFNKLTLCNKRAELESCYILEMSAGTKISKISTRDNYHEFYIIFYVYCIIFILNSRFYILNWLLISLFVS